MLHWTLFHFNDLNPSDLYAILRLRSEVFVVEQNCVFLDMDDKDQLCYHLMGRLPADGSAGPVVGVPAGDLVAYVRLVPPGVSYAEPSIGRVVTSPANRRIGLGKELMLKALSEVSALYGPGPVTIGAQRYLSRFYESLGFFQSGPEYLEDGILHLTMTKH